MNGIVGAWLLSTNTDGRVEASAVAALAAATPWLIRLTSVAALGWALSTLPSSVRLLVTSWTVVQLFVRVSTGTPAVVS